MTLYENTAEFAEIMELAQGETPAAEIAERLDLNEEAFSQKAEGYCKVIRDFEARAKACHDEAQRFYEAATRHKNAALKLKTALLNALDFRGSKVAAAGLYTISARTSQSVEVDNADTLPPEYQRVKIEADKALLKSHLREGVVIDGARLIENSNLRIIQ